MVDLRKKLRSGMIAVTPAGSYIGPDGFMIGSNYDENLSTILGICSIKALYRSTVNGLTYEMKYKDKDLIWTRDPKNLKELIISRRFSR